MPNSPEQHCAACPYQTRGRRIAEFLLRSGETTPGCEGPLRIHRGQAESATVTRIYSQGQRKPSEVIGVEQDMKKWGHMTWRVEYPNIDDVDSDDIAKTMVTDTYHRTRWLTSTVQCGREPVVLAEDEVPYGEFQGPVYIDSQDRRNLAIVRGDQEQLSRQRATSATIWILDHVEPAVSVTMDESGTIQTTVSAGEEY